MEIQKLKSWPFLQEKLLKIKLLSRWESLIECKILIQNGLLIQQYKLANILKIAKMKYKKELRWLLLMVIPFLIMFIAHLITPLTIAGSSQPLAATNYIVGNINLLENEIRSTNIIASQAIQNIINRYLAFIKVFNGFGLSTKKEYFLKNEISLISAYEFNSELQNTSKQYNKTAKKSMWFATNVTNSNNLSLALQQIYSRYLQIEPYFRALPQEPFNSTLSSISVLFTLPNQSIVFQYPSKYDYDYINISSSPYGSFYPSVLQSYINSNISSVSVISSQPDLNKSLLVICNPFTTDGMIVVPCIQLDITNLGLEVLNYVNLSVGINIKTFLVTNILQNKQNFNKNPNAFLLYVNGSQILQGSKITLNLTNTGVSNNNFAFKPSNSYERVFITRVRNFSSYISAINCQNNFSTTTILRVYTQSPPQIGSNIRVVNLQNNLKTMLIPNGILILIGTIISALVLKILLDSLDKQLFQLDNRCKFIVDGDIDVDISQHKGTEDIRKVYDQVRIINKIHKYSTSSYFSGHCAEKLLKYNEALQFMKKIGYDTGNILENMGEVCTHLQEWDNSLNYYNESVSLGLRELKELYNLTLQDVLWRKKQKRSLPTGYKQLQSILIRRMFKLNYTYIKYIELRSAFTKVDEAESRNDLSQFEGRMNKMIKLCFQNLRKLKICFYPDFSCYSQCIIALLCEAKQLANMKRIDEAQRMLQMVKKFNLTYNEQHSTVTQKLKQKNSKCTKLFRQRNKLTPHSRIHPQILKIVRNLFEAKIVNLSTDSYDKLIIMFDLLAEAMKTGYISLSFGYITAMELRKLLITLQIDPSKYQSTQIFQQAVPFKSLYYGQITKDNQSQLLRFPMKSYQGLQRQYVFLIDCAKTFSRHQSEYFHDRANYIFSKLIKPYDRLSIIKFSMKNGVKIECKLLIKQLNEEILQKEINHCFKEAVQSTSSLQQIVEGLYLAIERIKSLQCEKIIVMFFKSISFYYRSNQRKSKKKSDLFTETQTHEDSSAEYMNELGKHVLAALSFESLRNCKLIFCCSRNDSIDQFRTFFGLQEINKQLWNLDRTKNNLLYIIEDKHKSDLDRILMEKTYEAPDNHIFIL